MRDPLKYARDTDERPMGAIHRPTNQAMNILCTAESLPVLELLKQGQTRFAIGRDLKIGHQKLNRILRDVYKRNGIRHCKALLHEVLTAELVVTPEPPVMGRRPSDDVIEMYKAKLLARQTSRAEIAEECGVVINTVWYWLPKRVVGDLKLPAGFMNPNRKVQVPKTELCPIPDFAARSKRLRAAEANKREAMRAAVEQELRR
jgi:DNA-binding CsgD family transcriptional regulator